MTHRYPVVETPEQWLAKYNGRRLGQEMYHAGRPCPVEPGPVRTGYLYELGQGQYCRDLPCPTDPDAARGWYAMCQAEAECTYDDYKAQQAETERRQDRQYEQDREARRWYGWN